MLRIITGTIKNKKLEVPREAITRPVTDRVRAMIFDLIQEFVPGAKVLDLYAGSGALGIEALSRGAESAVFVDNSPEVIEIIKKNIKNSGIEDKSEVLQRNLPQALQKGTLKASPEAGPKAEQGDKNYFYQFDLVFCDPPFTKSDKFSLEHFAPVITTTNLFVLRAPAELKLTETELITPTKSFKIEYHKQVGTSSLYFIRQILSH